MRTGLGSKRWLGVTLLIALFLFSVADLGAKDARPMDIVPIVPCDFGEPDSDPWMVGAEPVGPCAGLQVSEVQSVEFFGDLALMTVVVEGGTESHVYRQTDTGWERIHVMSRDDGELDYWMELESAYNDQDQGVGPSRKLAIRSEPYAPYWMELESAYNDQDQGVGLSPKLAIRSEPYGPYWMELESAYND